MLDESVMNHLPNPDITLPYFKHPPIVEVAISVQFEPIANLRTPQIGVLWQQFRDRFPSTEDHPPLEPAIERFGVSHSPKGAASFQLLSMLPTPRCWFLNELGSELIQVQNDRFVHNWRKVGGSDTYPRYDHLRHTFKQELDRFEEFLRKEGLGELLPNQCEITYVNHIVLDEGSGPHEQLGDVVTLFNTSYTDQFCPQPEDCRINVRYIIPNSNGEPVGRLNLAVEPAYRKADQVPIFALTLTARGRPLSDDIGGVFEYLDVGRDWIVRTFASITTPRMHKLWRRMR